MTAQVSKTMLAVSRPTSVQSVSAHLLEHWHLKLFLQRCTPYPCKKGIQVNWIPVNLQPTSSSRGSSRAPAVRLFSSKLHGCRTKWVHQLLPLGCTKNISNHLLRAGGQPKSASQYFSYTYSSETRVVPRMIKFWVVLREPLGTYIQVPLRRHVSTLKEPHRSGRPSVGTAGWHMASV